MDPIIHRLRIARRAKGLTQAAAGALADIPSRTINEWEGGGGPTLSKLRRYAAALGFEIALVKRPSQP